MKTARGRWVIAAAVLGSGIAGIDSTVVNVALPTIGRSFHAQLATLQWTVTAYVLTLSAFLLIGGAQGDLYGRRKVFLIGVIWFAAASLLCGVAPSSNVLVGARALQGLGAALLMPESLAILQSSFHPDDRGKAIGAWAGLGGIALAIGPLLGGWLIQIVSWRVIFFINLPLVAVVVLIAMRHVPESRDPRASRHVDVTGAGLVALGLGGLVYGLIAAPDRGWSSPIVLGTLAGGVVALIAFVIAERRERHPMLPLGIFRSLQFTSANVVTLLVYGALSGSLFLIPTQLQVSLGYSPLEAGLALLPTTGTLLLFSSRAGALAHRIGPRIPMTVGPIVAGIGIALMYRVQPGAHYLTGFAPGIEIFALGLVLTVTPLTATVLAAAPVENAGIASAINNDAARAAGLIAVAAIPVAVGLSGSSYLHPAAFTHGFRLGMWLCGGLCVAGGVLSWFTISGERRYRRPVKQPTAADVSEPPRASAGRRQGGRVEAPEPPAVPARVVAASAPAGTAAAAAASGRAEPAGTASARALSPGDPARGERPDGSATAAAVAADLQDAPRRDDGRGGTASPGPGKSNRPAGGGVAHSTLSVVQGQGQGSALADCDQSEPQLHLLESSEEGVRLCRSPERDAAEETAEV